MPRLVRERRTAAQAIALVVVRAGWARKADTGELRDRLKDPCHDGARQDLSKSKEPTSVDREGQDGVWRLPADATPIAEPREDPKYEIIRCGASQNYPVVVPDRQSPNPYSSGQVQERDAPNAKFNASNHIMAHEQRLETPGVIPSSPPPRNTKEIRKSVDNSAPRKTTIIGFSKTGPLNQGTLLASRSKAESLRSGRSSTSSLVPRWNNFAESAQRYSAAANVAPTVSDALAGFTTKLYAARKEQQETARPKLDDPDALNKATDLSEIYDAGSPDVFDTHSPQAFTNHLNDGPSGVLLKPASLRTTSQIQMPPPKIESAALTKKQDKSEAHTIKNALGEVPTRKARTLKHPREDQEPLAQPILKKSRVEAIGDVAKLAARGIEQENGQVATPNDPMEEHPNDEWASMAQPFQPEASTRVLSNEADACETIFDQANMPNIDEYMILPHDIAPPVPQKPRSASIKVARVASLGTVDILGSPVPEGMVVEGNATVLEVFSRQYEVASDVEANDSSTLLGPKDSTVAATRGAVQRSRPDLQRARSPQSTHRRLFNRPVDYDQEGLRRTRLQFPHPAAVKSAETVEGRRSIGRDRNTKDTSEFLAQLRQSAIDACEDGQFDDLNENQDPDRTLVASPRPRRPSSRKRHYSISSSSEESTEIEEENDPMRKIAQWRWALRPHQMNLFDELVNVSHRLVSQLVDRESATENLIHDYHQRGLQIIAQLQNSHETQHQAAMADCKKKRASLRTELELCGKKLTEASEKVVSLERQRKQNQDGAKTCTMRLKELLASL